MNQEPDYIHLKRDDRNNTYIVDSPTPLTQLEAVESIEKYKSQPHHSEEYPELDRIIWISVVKINNDLILSWSHIHSNDFIIIKVVEGENSKEYPVEIVFHYKNGFQFKSICFPNPKLGQQYLVDDKPVKISAGRMHVENDRAVYYFTASPFPKIGPSFGAI